MRFSFGKSDWKTAERGEETCFLMTNGLGGFSSLTITGSCSRNDHAVLMACVESPNHRYHMIHRLEELLCIGEENIHISSQLSEEKEQKEEGFRFQSSFVFEDIPQWSYLVKGVEIEKTLVLQQGENAVGISYKIQNRSGKEAVLQVLPHLQFTPKGVLPKEGQKFQIENQKITSNGQELYFQTNGTVLILPERIGTPFYAADVCDGRRATGRTIVNHQISLCIPSGKTDTLTIVYNMRPVFPSPEEMQKELKQYRSDLKKQAGFEEDMAQLLSISVNQFISRRSSTAGQTILAGFPFFEDWGRDTMIAIHGCCLAVHQYQTAKSILETFMRYCKNGLMPNLFPEGTADPGYNTADASLLFILAVYEYYQRTEDIEFIRTAFPVMEEIISYYAKGTEYGIHMDTDGLLFAGQELDQVTWMDVRIGEILPTPRHGKPVEINAYWYNALCIMEQFSGFFSKTTADYGRMAKNVKENFMQFWNQKERCLKDVLSGTKADNQIRCNQIWAVSLPFSVLEPKYEKQVVETVFRILYTPYGLRTLAPEDREYCPFYGGSQMERDLAYHQGTIWVFPLGGYYLAYLKVHQYSEEAKMYVKEQLKKLEPALREGCIGQLPEIYDGENPVNSKGCFAQAWSTGEILRVYDALRITE